MPEPKRYPINKANSIPEFLLKLATVHDYVLLGVSLLCVMYLIAGMVVFLIYGGLPHDL